MTSACSFFVVLAVNLALVSIADTVRVTPPEFTGSKQPQIAVNESGHLFVAFGRENGVYVSKSDGRGLKFSDPSKVGEVEKLALGMRRGPRIAVTKQGVTITAISHADGNLYCWSSRDAGGSWSKQVTVNTVTNSAREGMHGLASDGKSKLMAVWLDLRSGKTELWGAISTNGGNSWASNTQIYKSPDQTICECCHPSVAFTSDGAIIVMWRNWLNRSRDIYQSISSDGGKTFSEARKIGTGTWPLLGCPMDGGDVGASGSAVSYVWRREQKLFVTSEPTSETLLAERGTHPIVVPTEAGFNYVWQDQGKLFWKSSNSESKLLSESGGYASAAWSPAHRQAFVVWEGTEGIHLEKLP